MPRRPHAGGQGRHHSFESPHPHLRMRRSCSRLQRQQASNSRSALGQGRSAAGAGRQAPAPLGASNPRIPATGRLLSAAPPSGTCRRQECGARRGRPARSTLLGRGAGCSELGAWEGAAAQPCGCQPACKEPCNSPAARSSSMQDKRCSCFLPVPPTHPPTLDTNAYMHTHAHKHTLFVTHVLSLTTAPAGRDALHDGGRCLVQRRRQLASNGHTTLLGQVHTKAQQGLGQALRTCSRA